MRNWTACGVGVAAVSAVMAPPDAAADAQEEAQKQAARLISQAIGDRIAARTDLTFESSPGAGDKAVWAISSYSKFDSAQDAAAAAAFDFGMNLGLLAGGYDWGVSDKVISGLNTSLYYFDGDSSADNGFGGTVDTALTGVGFTVAPYVAYQVNEYFFLSGVLGVGYSSFTADIPAQTIDFGPPLGSFTSPAMSITSGATTFNADLAANFVQSAGPVSFREKVLYRANYSLPDSGADGTVANSFGVGAEAEVKVGQSAGLYLNAESNYVIDDEAAQDRYPVYVGAGINFRPSEYMQFGAGYQTEFGDDTSDISSVLVTGRIKFRGGLQSADNRVTPVDNRVTPVDDYQSLYEPASSPAGAPPSQYQQFAAAPSQAPQSALGPPPQQGFQPQYQQYQQPAAQSAWSQGAYQGAYQQPAVDTRGGAPAQSGASEVCETRLNQGLQMRAQAGRRSPDEDASSFRAVYDDYDRCLAAAR